MSVAPGPEHRTGRVQMLVATLAFVYLAAITSASTQYVAWRLHYHPALGTPWFRHVYPPWAWFGWTRWYGHASVTFNRVYVGYVAALGLAFLGYVLSVGLRTRRPLRNDTVHGTAHWATEDEIRATGLLSGNGGVYVGGWTDRRGRLHYLRHNGPEHVAAVAPPRTGKGLGLVNPTLLSWPHSVVVNDQKGELWNLTSNWRKHGAANIVLKFDPAAPAGSAGYNPLDEIRIGTEHEVGDVQNVVTILVDPDGKGLVDHWAKTSHAFLTGVILHLEYLARARGQTASLPDLAMSLSDPARPVEKLYDEMLNNRHMGGRAHPTVAAAARDMLNRPDEERGSVLSTAMSFLSLYRDPLVAKNVSRTDFHITDLMNSDRPVSLYLVVNAEDKDRMKPLMRLIINQLVRVLLRPDLKFENGRPLPPHKHRLLLMLDEFPSYGKLEVLQEALAYIPAYGIKAYLIMQDVAQLWNAYGRDGTILSNCHVIVAYAPNKIETAEWLSKMTGTMTVVKEDISTSGSRFGAVLGHVTRHLTQLSRPLATPDEIMRLRAPKKDGTDRIVQPGDVLVFVAGHAPILGTQSLFFRDCVFLARASEVQAD